MRTSAGRIGVIALLTASLLLQSGCATIIDGRRQTIRVDSNVEGASVERRGVEIGRTPCDISLPRWSHADLVISKEGYETRRVSLDATLNPTALLDLPWFLLGLVPGFAAVFVDAATGAVFEYESESVRVRLRRAGPKPEAKSGPRSSVIRRRRAAAKNK